MRCCRFFKRAASFEQPVNLIVQRFRAGAAGKRSPEQRVLYQLVEQQIDDPDVLGIYTSGKQQITGDSLVTDPGVFFFFVHFVKSKHMSLSNLYNDAIFYVKCSKKSDKESLWQTCYNTLRNFSGK